MIHRFGDLRGGRRKRNRPRSLVLLSGVATIVGLSPVGASASPLALVAERGWGTAAGSILAIIALSSTTNTVLILQISTSRMLYGVSKAEHRSCPAVPSRVHVDRRTPHYAVLLVGAVTVGFSLLGVVAGLANLFLLVVNALVNGALLALRFREPDREWGFRARGNLGRLSLTAVGGVVSSVGFAAFYLARWTTVL